MKNPQDGMTRQSMTAEDPVLPLDFSDDMENWDLRIPEPDEFGLSQDAMPSDPILSDAQGAAFASGLRSRLLQGFGQDDHPEEEPDERYCCVFMESGYEATVGKIIEYCGVGSVSVPQRVLPQYSRDKWRNVIKPLLPGYLFIRGEPARYRLRQINHVIRPLRYADGEFALRGDDLDFARMMFSLDGTIPKLKAVEEGSFVRVTDSLLPRMNGKVLSVNKRGHLAKIEINLVGRPTTFWLGLDLPEINKGDKR